VTGGYRGSALGAARTLLFVPGSRPDRFDKAFAAGADLVVLDLEDAVGPDAKQEARNDVVEAVRRAGRTPVAVRINAPRTPWHDEDVDALAGLECGVMVPKAESTAALRALAARLPGASRVIALIESAAGVLAAEDIARSPEVARLAFGSLDLAAELNVDPDDRTALLFARMRLLFASAAAGLAPPIDGVTADVRDAQRLESDVEYAKRLGYAAKLCIHPAQLATVERLFRPGADEVAWARRVLDAAAGVEDGGVVTLDGAMVDAPVVKRARSIAMAGR